jgi:hypothetical protein
VPSDDRSAAPRRTTAKISPYVVFRRSRLPVDELAGLRFDRFWARIDECGELQVECTRRAGELSDRLAGLVPVVDEPVRAELVRLRRDVHNQRVDAARRRLEIVESRLDPATLAEVRAWLDLVQRLHHGEAESQSLFDETMESARAGFGRIFAHDSMARSIQLSGDQLYESLRRYVSGESGSVKPSRARIIENSLVNFAYRAALKPSPFGRFTEVGAFPLDLSEDGLDEPDTETYSTTTLNRVIVNWLAGGLRRVDGGLDLGWVLLNSSLQVDENMIQFIGLVPDPAKAGVTEAVVRLKRDKVVECVLSVMATGTAPVPDVLRALTELTGNEEVSRKTLRVLMGTELLYVSPGIDEQDVRYSAKMLSRLSSGTTEPVSALAGHLGTLHELETALSDAPAEKRQHLLTAAGEAITGIGEVCGIDLPPEEITRAPVYEDLWTRAPAATWSRHAMEANMPAMESLWRLASMLDYGHMKRLGLYGFAARTFGDRETVPFLTFFDRLIRLSQAEQDAVFWGRGSTEADTFLAQRTEALRDIGRQLVPEDGVVRLTPQALTDACARVQDCVDPDSITFRLQFAGGGPSPEVVVNGVLTGYGVYFSRFAAFIEQSPVEGWTLRNAVRDHLRQAFPGQVDLNMVAGLNFNLHPPLTDRILNYPGTWPTAPDLKAYSFDRLSVRIDHANRGLCLWDPVVDEPVNLIPMNFLLPIVVPLLYQTVEALVPTIRYSWRPMDNIGRAMGHLGYPESAPRLMIGDVVASRRSWTVPAREIPELAELRKDSYPALVRFDEWRRRQGLPQHAFVVSQRLDEYNLLTGRVERIPRDWADFRNLQRASVHKPMYVDFRNPYLVRSFAKAALLRDDIYVSIQECLPASEEYGGRGPASAEEFFVELYRN